mmetsp:Transcript_30422/g.65176  ORF Transcript_30422/g.65176 Transcript_30422/m.65176 type:complete len:157 (+) Transcript_30422:24-494(+)
MESCKIPLFRIYLKKVPNMKSNNLTASSEDREELLMTFHTIHMLNKSICSCSCEPLRYIRLCYVSVIIITFEISAAGWKSHWKKFTKGSKVFSSLSYLEKVNCNGSRFLRRVAYDFCQIRVCFFPKCVVFCVKQLNEPKRKDPTGASVVSSQQNKK